MPIAPLETTQAFLISHSLLISKLFACQEHFNVMFYYEYLQAGAHSHIFINLLLEKRKTTVEINAK